MPRTKPLLVEIGEGLSIMIGSQTISTWKSESRPKNPKKGTFGFNTESNSLEYWDGKNWFSASMDKP